MSCTYFYKAIIISLSTRRSVLNRTAPMLQKTVYIQHIWCIMKLLRFNTNISVAKKKKKKFEVALAFTSQTDEMWFALVRSGWEIHLPHWLRACWWSEGGRDGGGSGVWEYERGTAGLLLSGLKSLGAPASKQSQLCFQGGQTLSGHDCAPLHFQSQEF